jgi:catechol 2,3-dioxygenase-like lactoylglutathione lyase family enzyme
MFKRIDHVEIVPSDFERAIKFYTEVLGFKIEDRIKVDRPPLKELAFLGLGGTTLEFFSVVGPEPTSEDTWRVGCRRIALEVEDVAKAIDFLKSKGVTITREPTSSATSVRAEFEDPDGLSIEMRQLLEE